MWEAQIRKHSDAINEIAQTIEGKECVLFIGSGVSACAGMPTGQEVASILAKDLRAKGAHSLPMIAQAYEEAKGRPNLIRALQKALYSNEHRPHAVHEALLKLGVRVWLTTNFDQLIESAFHECNLLSRPIGIDVIVTASDFATTKKAHQLLVKIHGDLPRRAIQKDDIVITQNDFFQSLTKRQAIYHWVQGLLLEHSVLFLGYGLEDWDIGSLLAQSLLHMCPNGLRPSYAVIFEDDPVKSGCLRSLNVSPLYIPAKKEERCQILLTFLQEVERQLMGNKKTSDVEEPQEFLEGEAHQRVPDYLLREMSGRGYRLEACIERCTYVKVIEEFQSSAALGPGLQVPSKYLTKRYEVCRYIRMDDDGNLWSGIAFFTKNGRRS